LPLSLQKPTQNAKQLAFYAEANPYTRHTIKNLPGETGMKSILTQSLALTALSLALVACGGGGKSSSTAKTQNPAPTPAPASITENNLESVLATSFQVAADSGANNTKSAESPEILQSNLGEGIQRAAEATQNTTQADSATGVDFTVLANKCAYGGQATGILGLSPGSTLGTSITDSLRLSASFDFKNCRASTLWMDGKAKLELTSVAGLLPTGSTLDIGILATLDNFFVAETQSKNPAIPFKQAFGVSGKVRLNVSNPDRQFIQALLTTDSGSKLTYRLVNGSAEAVQVDDFSFELRSSMKDASYTMSTHGNILFTNPNAKNAAMPTNRLRFNSSKQFAGQGFAVPHTGVLKVWDNDATAELRVLDQYSVEMALDKNNDGVFDTLRRTTWAEFLNISAY
jgi:hypothetical protein